MNEGPEATADDLSQIRNLVRALFKKTFITIIAFNTRGRVLFLIVLRRQCFLHN